jgi:hypothetical protein
MTDDQVPAVEPFTDIDRYVPRPDVPGHVFTRVGELRGSSWGYTVTCSCGVAFGWDISPEVTAIENRHRIAVLTGEGGQA